VSEINQRLAHSSWDCKYHVVIVPKRRRKVLFWPGAPQAGRYLPRVGVAEGVPDHRGTPAAGPVHMCIAIPPKYPVASVIGFLKGKSAIAMARLCCKERNFTGEHFCFLAFRPPAGA
jgi:putative transposase